jgi:serine O-acetyltransferase
MIERKMHYHWGVDETVTQLRKLRVQSLEERKRRDKPPKLPSRKELQHIVDGLSSALFPNRLGRPDLTEEGIDYYVGFVLDRVLHELFKQVRRELQFNAENGSFEGAVNQDAIEIIKKFTAQLPTVRALIDTDIQAAYEGDPAARTSDEVLVCYPGITAVIYQRLAHILYVSGAPLVARMITELAHSTTGIDIHPGAQIGKRFFIDHGTGVVIGETAIIGENVRLYQAVTLGAKRFQKDKNGVLVKGNLRHPIVEDDVVIYAGATILGRVTIGHGSIIGGNVWLTHNVPPFSIITQASERSE